LCRHFGLQQNQSHRAMSDARATLQLFRLLCAETMPDAKSQDTLQQAIKDNALPSAIDRATLNNISDATGVYFFYNRSGDLIYVGKSKNIRKRIMSHFSADVNSPKSQKMKQLVHRIDYRETGSELLALLLESDLIKRHQPAFNRSQRQTRYRYGLFVDTNQAGYLCFSIQRLNRYQLKTDVQNLVIAFSNRKQADAFLDRAIEKYQLCGKLAGIEHSRGPCFHYHLKRCLGACVGKETSESYNARAKKLMQQFNYEDESFVILTDGRTVAEKGFVWIHKGVYRGFGYLPVEQVTNISMKLLQQYLTPLPDNQDVRKIINRYLKTTRRPEKIVFR
jgi:DNA polymerase-3 subunit epsilon